MTGQVDRTTGLVGDVAIKAPCRAATTAAITLSEEQTVDGVALVTGDRCLVKDQASGVENGIYTVDTGDWSRSADADGSRDWATGSMVKIVAGTTNGGNIGELTTTGTIVVDTTSLTFVMRTGTLSAMSAYFGTLVGAATAYALRVLMLFYCHGADIAAAATLDLSTATGDLVDITGNTGITAITLSEGDHKICRFTGTPTLTNGASLVLLGAGDITMAAGDVAMFRGYAAGVVRMVSFSRASKAITVQNLSMTTARLLGRTTASTGAVEELTVGSGLTMTGGVLSNSAARSYISGFSYANGTDAVNDIDIAAGSCSDSTNAADITLSSTLVKQLDAAWAVGTNQGGLDTGSIGNSDYYIWAIKRPDTGITDVLFSLSSTAPTMPTNYTLKRLIGWFKRVGGTIVAFTTYETEGGGIELLWTVPTLDVSLANTLTTSRRTDAMKVPLNFSTTAHINAVSFDTALARVWICCPDQTDAAPSGTAAPLMNLQSLAGAAGQAFLKIRTSSAGLIASRSTLATVDEYYISTMGFEWARRN